MEITKDGETYKVNETTSEWIVKAMDGKVKLTYKLSKNDFGSIGDVQKYFRELDI